MSTRSGFPSIEIGMPVIALRKVLRMRNLYQAVAPSSIATIDRTTEITRTNAAKTLGIYFFSAKTMAVLPNPQAESPAAILPCLFATETIFSTENAYP